MIKWQANKELEWLQENQYLFHQTINVISATGSHGNTFLKDAKLFLFTRILYLDLGLGDKYTISIRKNKYSVNKKYFYYII